MPGHEGQLSARCPHQLAFSMGVSAKPRVSILQVYYAAWSSEPV